MAKCRVGCTCRKHEGNGGAPRIDDASLSYKGVHTRIAREFGKASDYQCTDCNNPARYWSWTHNTDPTNIYNYYPRCSSCHAKYDYTDEQRAKQSATHKKNWAEGRGSNQYVFNDVKTKA